MGEYGGVGLRSFPLTTVHAELVEALSFSSGVALWRAKNRAVLRQAQDRRILVTLLKGRELLPGNLQRGVGGDLELGPPVAAPRPRPGAVRQLERQPRQRAVLFHRDDRRPRTRCAGEV